MPRALNREDTDKCTLSNTYYFITETVVMTTGLCSIKCRHSSESCIGMTGACKRVCYCFNVCIAMYFLELVMLSTTLNTSCFVEQYTFTIIT